jgi:lysophospholipase L1-like esterase
MTIEAKPARHAQILVYSDSLTWGIMRNTRERLPFNERWPGVPENALNKAGRCVRVMEDCLNGRRTVCNRGETVCTAWRKGSKLTHHYRSSS